MDLTAAIAAAADSNPMPFTHNVAPVEGRVLHVDGDYCAYYCAGSDDTDAGSARRNLIERLRQAKRASGATKIIVHLSANACTKGERYLIAQSQPYQGQRNTGRKPDNWLHLREFMEGYTGVEFTPKIWLNREADDGMAYVCHHAAKDFGLLHAVYTADKDMRMFAGLHIVWKTFQQVELPLDTYDLVGPDGKQYGHKWFWNQMLMGDTADHIPGLKGVGEKTAAGWLKDTKDNDDGCRVVCNAYRISKGQEWADYFVEQAGLLWMRTDREAAVDNFLVLHCFGDDHDTIHAATRRMVLRVMMENARLGALRS